MVEMDEIYRTLAPESIPWNLEDPPEALVELVESGRVKPGRAIDLGCGAGNYAVYLAEQGFDVTGVDISSAAVELASAKARERGVSCRFLASDLTGTLVLEEKFDFAYDWEVLHHIYPGDRPTYVENVSGLLEPGGLYMSVCFSEKSPQFGGTGKYRETPLGTVLYFSSEDELRELFEPHFMIIELKTIEIQGKFSPHLAVYTLLEKK